jgi:predicted ATPase
MTNKRFISGNPVVEIVKASKGSLPLTEVVAILKRSYSEEQIYANVRKATQTGILFFDRNMQLALKQN